MTTKTILNCYGRYLEMRPKEQRIKELPEVSLGDMIQIHEEELELAQDIENELQTNRIIEEQYN